MAKTVANPSTKNGKHRRWLVSVAVGIVALGAFAAIPMVAPAQDVQIDMDAVFRCVDTDEAICEEGRSLIVTNCTLCHTYAPIVLQQFDEGGWRGLLDRHRMFASELTDEQFETLQTYLAANFNPDMDPPEVPAAVLKAWTDY